MLHPVGNITSFGQDASGELYLTTQPGKLYRIAPDGLVRGDMNGDEAVNAFDIEPFVTALTDCNAYGKRYPNIDPDEIGDANCDAVLDAFDIAPFISFLL